VSAADWRLSIDGGRRTLGESDSLAPTAMDCSYDQPRSLTIREPAGLGEYRVHPHQRVELFTSAGVRLFTGRE
jgi:hypothetical protein